MPAKKARWDEQQAMMDGESVRVRRSLDVLEWNVWYFHVSILQKLDLKLSCVRACIAWNEFSFFDSSKVISYKCERERVCFSTYITDRHVYTFIHAARGIILSTSYLWQKPRLMKLPSSSTKNMAWCSLIHTHSLFQIENNNNSNNSVSSRPFAKNFS